MVPLRSESGRDSSFSRSSSQPPRLRLVTSSDDGFSTPPRRAKKRRRSGNIDRICFAALVLTIIIACAGGALTTMQAAVTRALSFGAGHPVVVGIVVKPGDTLWKYAKRDGAPGNYMLANVDAIARENGVDPSAPLTPGQHLRIQVENPALLAKLQPESRVASTPFAVTHAAQ